MVRALVLTLAAAVAPAPLHGSAGGPPLDRVRIPWPAETAADCTSCHSGRPNQFPGSIAASGLPAAWEPGRRYDVIVELMDPDPARTVWGFAAALVTCDLADAGTMHDPRPGTETRLDVARGVTFARSNALGKLSLSWGFAWTAPAAASGTATLYVCGVGGDGSGTPFGDHVFCSSASLPEQAGLSPGPIARLQGIAKGADLVWSWEPEPLALRGYRIYAVAAKESLPLANRATPAAQRVCPAPTAADVDCTEAGAAGGTGLLLYQVVGVTPCVEGPN